MQLFPCPFCGPRDETEFHFGAEADKSRPEPAQDVSGARWVSYLYETRNPKGESREIWIHLTCGEFFILHRDTVSHAVLGSESISRSAP